MRVMKVLIYYAIYPNVSAANTLLLQTGQFADNVKSIVQVHQENLKYKRENLLLSDKIRFYEAIKEEYGRLANFFSVPKIPFMRTIVAPISVREPSEWYQWLIIAKGKNDGAADDLPVSVLGRNGQLSAAGRIVETYDNSAKVMLITNILSAVPAKIKNKNINCLAEGANTRMLKITYIPFNADIAAGDEVIVSGLSSVFMEDTPIAVIKSVSKDSAVDFKSALAEVYFESDILREVVVSIPQKEQL